MLKLTKKADYGLMAMKHMAERASTEACSAKELADAYGIPPEALAKILQRLVKAGLLHSQHGTNGGYTLARDPKTISAFEVIRVIDGPLFITSKRALHHPRTLAESEPEHRRRAAEHQYLADEGRKRRSGKLSSGRLGENHPVGNGARANRLCPDEI
jgi:Rrf2 family protein